MTGGDRDAAQLVVAVGDSAHVVDRRHVADELLGGDRDVGAGLERSPLLGVARQVEQCAGDHRAGGLGATVEQQQRIGQGISLGEGLAVDRCCCVVAEDVVGGAAALLLEQLRGLRVELHVGGDAIGIEVARSSAQGDRSLGPVAQLRPPLVGKAEQTTDHPRRQRRGEIGDHLDVLLL